MEYHEILKSTLRKPMAVVAFPTIGLSGVIAAQYLIEKLKLPLLGSLWSHATPPSVLVRRGQWEPPIAVYGKEVVCGPGSKCESLLLVTSSVPLEKEAFWQVAEALEERFKATGVELAVVLDSQAVEESVDPTRVSTIASGKMAVDFAKKTKLPSMTDGIVAGIPASLLVMSHATNRPTVVLVTEAHESHPDARAAAYQVKVLDDHLIRVGVDLEPLIEQAVRIEKTIRDAGRRTQAAETRARQALSTMYG